MPKVYGRPNITLTFWNQAAGIWCHSTTTASWGPTPMVGEKIWPFPVYLKGAPPKICHSLKGATRNCFQIILGMWLDKQSTYHCLSRGSFNQWEQQQEPAVKTTKVSREKSENIFPIKKRLHCHFCATLFGSRHCCIQTVTSLAGSHTWTTPATTCKSAQLFLYTKLEKNVSVDLALYVGAYSLVKTWKTPKTNCLYKVGGEVWSEIRPFVWISEVEVSVLGKMTWIKQPQTCVHILLATYCVILYCTITIYTCVMGDPGLSVWNHLYVQQTAIKQFSSWRHKNMWSLSDIGCLRDFNICSKLHFSTSNTVFNIIILCSLHLTFQTCLITDICFHHLPPSPSLLGFFSFPSLATGGRTASVQNGANINAKDMPKMTALHRVAQRSHREVAELPLRYEADIDCLSKFHETPLDIAMDTSNTELMILLQVDGRMVGGHTRGERDRQSWEKNKKGAKMNQMSEWDRRMKGGETRMDEDRKRERGEREKETPRRWWREEKLMTGKNRYRRTDNWEGKRRVRHAGRRTEKQRRVKSGQLSYSNTKHVVARLLNKIRERETLGEEKTENDPADFRQCR